MTDLAFMLPGLARGVKVTLALTVAAAALAVPVALAAGLARGASARWLAWPAAVFVEVFRGTSALVQLFWVYFVLPLFGVELPAMWTGILVLGLNAGAYGAEVVRGAVAAVPRDQYDAARALGLGPRRTMLGIVLPQAAPAMLPPAGNLLVELLKNTALVSLITLADLTFNAQLLRSETFRTLWVFGLALLIYFALAQVLLVGVRLAERRLARRRRAGA